MTQRFDFKSHDPAERLAIVQAELEKIDKYLTEYPDNNGLGCCISDLRDTLRKRERELIELVSHANCNQLSEAQKENE